MTHPNDTLVRLQLHKHNCLNVVAVFNDLFLKVQVIELEWLFAYLCLQRYFIATLQDSPYTIIWNAPLNGYFIFFWSLIHFANFCFVVKRIDFGPILTYVIYKSEYFGWIWTGIYGGQVTYEFTDFFNFIWAIISSSKSCLCILLLWKLLLLNGYKAVYLVWHRHHLFYVYVLQLQNNWINII